MRDRHISSPIGETPAPATEGGMHGLDFKLLPVCALSLRVSGRDVVGLTPGGLRAVGHLGEGKVEGPRLKGIVLPGGADWSCLRNDGIMEVDAKLMIRTHDGAIIQMSYTGAVDLGEDAFDRALKGMPPAGPPVSRTAPRMATSAPAYLWVNRRLFLGVGAIDYGPVITVRYDIYEVQ